MGVVMLNVMAPASEEPYFSTPVSYMCKLFMQICPWCCRAVLDPAGVDVVNSGNWSLKLNPVANVISILWL
jgi:hypothetical protein